MLTQEDFKIALEAEIKKAGTQTALAARLGMTQSQISDYLRGRFQLKNMTLGNLFKLFPCAQISLSGIICAEPMAKSMEDQLLTIYRQLSPEEMVKCLTIVVANFPDIIKEKCGK